MYVYRFIDSKGQILYVGKTVDIDRRMREHFGGKGHLKDVCYNSTCKIEFMKFDTEVDSLIAETYFINLWKPPYNKLNKGNSNKRSTLIEIEPNFKIYKVLKPQRKQAPNTGINLKGFVTLLRLSFWGYIIYMILKMFSLI